ncbi:MAG: calcium-binding protein [Planctomycetota bacterium]
MALTLATVLAAGNVATAQGTIAADEPVWDQVTTRVSVDRSGGQANGQSELLLFNQAISGDGRFVVFRSYATNLVPGDTNRVPDIFLHDRLTGETSRVSVSSQGKQPNAYSSTPSISADGRYVAFASWATNLVPGDGNDVDDVFVHDRLTGETTRVSVDSMGTEGDDRSYRPSTSGDGRYVAFHSKATNLVSGDVNNMKDVFVHDRLTGETTRVSVDSKGTEGNGDSGDYWPSISPDGRYVAFCSEATNLVPGDMNEAIDVFVHDRVTRETTRVSVDSTGDEGDSVSWCPSICTGGRHVAFNSFATNLVAGDTNGVYDVFVHDRLTATTTRVSVDSTGAQVEFDSWSPAISGDGRYVAFHSSATFDQEGSTAANDVFVHDRLTHRTWAASVNYWGVVQILRGWNDSASISADGRYVAFEGVGAGLVQGDTNADVDVFVRGPELTLDAEPTAVIPNSVLTLTEYKGVAGNLASLWALDLNGVATFLLVASGGFGADGNFVVSGVVPDFLSGGTVTFRGYAVGHSGSRVQTNDVRVSFQ